MVGNQEAEDKLMIDPVSLGNQQLPTITETSLVGELISDTVLIGILEIADEN